MNALAAVQPDERLTIPALLGRAGQRLLDARSSGEILEAKKFAEAALHLAKVTDAANETHADCLRIITRAEIRMADEIDAGQKRGEVATQERGRPGSARTSGASTATLKAIGVSSQRVAEWRETRDAGEEVVEKAIKAALDEGRAPTKEDIKRAAKGLVRGTFGTGENEWYTPAEVIQAARSVLGGIDLDPASSEHAQRTVQALRYFTLKDDGLEQDWRGTVWLNPPYAQPHIENFADKMIAEIKALHVTSAIMLTHNYTDTAWFHKLAAGADAICFTKGRIRFEAPDGTLAAPTQGQAFFYFGSQTARFLQVFTPLGFVVGALIS